MESRQPLPRFVPPPDLGPEVFAGRRERLLERIGGGVAVIPAAPELYRSRDTEVTYRPSSDLYYLTGILEPESVAVITPHDPERRFTLFVRPRDPDRERWSGPRIGVERAGDLFGADAVHPIHELDERLPDLLSSADAIHFPLGAVSRVDQLVRDAILRARSQRQRSGRGPTALVDLEAATSELRMIKDDTELERIRVAAEISAEGHLLAMQRARPGAGEWEIQAILEGAFRSLGAAGPAFPSIVGAGPNATVLHYVTHQSRMVDGELLLIDAGAEWGMYCGDVTRTFPVSGRFSPEQRDLYELVLTAQQAAITAAIPGSTAADVHRAAVKILAGGMIDLGLLPEDSPEQVIEGGTFKRFYPHQTSHWLGLDVHDVGLYSRGGESLALTPGMVLTIEPGIYIPADADDVPEHFRGIGIRIEDDLVITESGHELLTRAVPVAVAEIEALMQGK